MGAHETRTFRSGDSEAVRLPEGMGFGIGIDLRVERDGDRIVLTPIAGPAEEKRKVLDLLAALAAIGRPDDGVQLRPDCEAPERQGL